METVNQGRLTVRGDGLVHVKPDVAVVGIVAEKRGKDSTEATAKVQELLENAKKALKLAHAPVKGLKHAMFDVKPYYERESRDSDPVQNGFVATVSAQLDLPISTGTYIRAINQITKNCPEIRTSLRFQINSVGGTSERLALRTACHNAVASAKVLAKSLECELGPILEVVKDDAPTPLSARALSANTDNIEDVPSVDIRAGVTITFALRQNVNI